ncbi:hypothetical protein ATANTOWER_025087 [Ataeniobius toweri]|uniref:Uncharacterized protein n=1 Tax=Ataeniobius toweri TaxID=208326 RepID=A0ABU7B8K3_9TELE|nr:hypothetical protein [Ataeniobius toweri]
MAAKRLKLASDCRFRFGKQLKSRSTSFASTKASLICSNFKGTVFRLFKPGLDCSTLIAESFKPSLGFVKAFFQVMIYNFVLLGPVLLRHDIRFSPQRFIDVMFSGREPWPRTWRS